MCIKHWNACWHVHSCCCCSHSCCCHKHNYIYVPTPKPVKPITKIVIEADKVILKTKSVSKKRSKRDW